MNYMKNELGIWDIAVLALLQEAPMHPYEMRRLLKIRHKDEILALKSGSLYHSIARLQRAGLIAVETTERDGKRPERTTYHVTSAGLDALMSSLRMMVSTPRRESSEFMAAMSFLVYLDSAEAVRRLEERARKLEAEIVQVSAGLGAASAFVERINLVESEYLQAMLKAELGWVRGLENEIRSGRLDWNLEKILKGIRASRDAARKPEV